MQYRNLMQNILPTVVRHTEKQTDLKEMKNWDSRKPVRVGIFLS